MRYFINKKLLFTFLLSVNIQSVDYTKAHLQSFINDSNLNSPVQKKEENTFLHRFFSIFKSQEIKEIDENLSLYDSYNYMYNLLKNTDFFNNAKTITSDKCCFNLNFLDSENLNKETILNFLNLTQTYAGEIFLLDRITHPTDSIDQIEQRQDLIKYLIGNSTVKVELEKQLEIIANNQNAFFKLWEEEKNEEELEKLLEPLYFKKKGITKFFYPLNKSRLYQEPMSGIRPLIASAKLMGEPFVLFSKVFSTSLLTLFCHLDNEKEIILRGSESTFTKPQTAVDFLKIIRKDQYEHYKYIFSCKWAPEKTVIKDYINNQISTLIKEKPAQVAAATSLGLGVATYWYFSNTYQYRKQLALQHYLHLRMNKIANIIHAKNEIIKILNQNPKLKKNLTYSQYLETPEDSDTKNIMNLLDSNTFKGNPTNFSRTGKIVAGYGKIKDSKNNFGPLFIALGEIDCTIAVTNLYLKQSLTNTPLHFVTCKKAETPHIAIKNMWHPLIAPNKVVKNSAIIGTQNNPRNIILTGPNAGGKSTFLKNITLALLLAQSTGLVPADSLEFTPFSSIDTYMNIADNITKEESLFVAEVRRLKELLNKADNLKDNNQFVFTVLDELFTGTNPEEAQKISYQKAEQLGEKDNCITILATHFHNLTTLEQATQNYKNYRVSVNYDDNNNFYYTFKIQPGISNQNIAIQVLEKEGL